MSETLTIKLEPKKMIREKIKQWQFRFPLSFHITVVQCSSPILSSIFCVMRTYRIIEALCEICGKKIHMSDLPGINLLTQVVKISRKEFNEMLRACNERTGVFLIKKDRVVEKEAGSAGIPVLEIFPTVAAYLPNYGGKTLYAIK